MEIFFPNNLKYLRKSLKMTQEAFGEKIGKKKSMISNYEQGLVEPNVTVLVSISLLFEIDINRLLFLILF